MTRLRLVRGLAAGVALCAGFAAVAQSPFLTQSRIGAGVESLRDWSRSQMLADLVYSGRAWGSPTDPWQGQSSIILDANGWPTQDAGMIFMTGQVPSSGQGGIYHFSFECATLPEVRLVASSGTVQNVQRDSVTGIVTGEIVFPEDGTQLMLGFFNTSDGTTGGVRNLRLLRPGTTPGQLFTQRFIDHVNRFDILRFMDTNMTNQTTVSQWSNRTQMTQPNWRSRTGMPYEAEIALCNTVDADMFICVPHLADDNYIRQLARLIRDTLEPQRNVYVEFSNEVWNIGFQQGIWNRDQAALEVAAGNTNLTYDGNTNPTVTRFRRYARESKRVADIFMQEFNVTNPRGRVRPILSGQTARLDIYDYQLQYINDVYGPPRNYFYSIGVAPYFEAWTLDTTNPNLTVDQFITGLTAGVSKWNTDLQLEYHATTAAWYNLAPMVAYEGGVDTRFNSNLNVKRLATYDERMFGLCKTFLDDWHRQVGGDFVWSVAGAGPWNISSGSYTLTENMLDQATTKIRALDAVDAAPLPPLEVTRVPGVIDARRHPKRNPATWSQSPGSAMLLQGQGFDYMVQTDVPRTVPVTIYHSTSEANASVTLFVGGVENATVQLPINPNPNAVEFFAAQPVNVTFPAGVSTLRVVSNRTQGFVLQTIILGGCDDIDFNRNGIFPEDQDVIDYFNTLAGAPCPYNPGPWDGCDIDFNNNGVFPEDQDVIDFFTTLAGGTCP
jgi:hypothetical protein